MNKSVRSWLNRDPVWERGFELIRQLRNPKQKHGRSFSIIGEIKEGPDLYVFVRNNPVNAIDPV